MAEEIRKHVRLQLEKKQTPATMRLYRYAKRERQWRAAKLLLLSWLAAGASVLIPVVHFFLVPGFFIAGIVLGWRALKKEEEGIDVQGKCPACEKEVVLSLEREAASPLWRKCPECGASIGIHEGSAT